MSFPGRAGEAFQSEAGGAEGLFYGSFAAVGYQLGAGGAAGSNVAEDCLIPQIGLGGRGECIIIYHSGDTGIPLPGVFCRARLIRIPRKLFCVPAPGMSSCVPAPGMSSCFPIVFCSQISNVCTGLVQDEVNFGAAGSPAAQGRRMLCIGKIWHFHILFPRAIVHKVENF